MKHPIPSEALAHHLAFLGKTGSGKSNAAKVIVEQLLDKGERVCIVDPTGSWYGLRLKADGTPSKYPVVIFGGLHGDVEIGRSHGAPIAEVVATSATPAVIDTRLMGVNERTEFFTAFAETLLRKNRGPLHLVIDEAHIFAPQSGGAGGKNIARNEMLHAANNLVSLGRSAGLRITLISQRPAKLHKDSLTQVETLVAMRLIHNLDVDAVKTWIGEWANPQQGKEIVASLPSLPVGDAWVWMPEIDFLRRVHFPLALTYDSGRAPTGEDGAPELKPIDLEEVTALLGKAGESIKANDPRALKAEVARLTRELAATQRKVAAPPKPEIIHANAEEIEAAREQGRREGLADGLRQAMEAIKALGGGKTAPPRPARSTAVTARPTPTVVADGTVPQGCAKPLAALASVYPSGLTEPQWATAAGYKRSGGTWGTYKSRLRGAGLIEQREGRWFATEVGATAVGDVELPPSPGPDLVRWWAAKLPGTSRMAEALIEAWPNALSRDELALRLDMAPLGGSFGTYLSRLAGPGLITRDGGEIRLTEEVMG